MNTREETWLVTALFIYSDFLMAVGELEDVNPSAYFEHQTEFIIPKGAWLVVTSPAATFTLDPISAVDWFRRLPESKPYPNQPAIPRRATAYLTRDVEGGAVTAARFERRGEGT